MTKQNILQIVGKYFSNIDSNEHTGEIIGVEGKSGTGKSLLIEHIGKNIKQTCTFRTTNLHIKLILLKWF